MRVAVLTVVLLGCYLGAQANMSQQYIDYILQMHNQYGNMQGNGNNMYNMMWNEDLAQQAYQWVSQCRFDNGNYGNGFYGNGYFGNGFYGNNNYGNSNFGNSFYSNNNFGNGNFENGFYGNNYGNNNGNYGYSFYGNSYNNYNNFWQNQAFYYGNNDMDNMGQAFSDWNQYYNYANSNGGVSRAYNQMEWYNAKEVGCAYYQCPSMNYYGSYMQNTWFFACRYNPMIEGNWNEKSKTEEFTNMNNMNYMGNMNYMNNMEMNNMGNMKFMNNMEMNNMEMNNMNNMEMNNMNNMGNMNNMEMNNFGYNQEFVEGQQFESSQQFENNFSGDCMDKYPNCPRFSYKCQSNQMWMSQYCPMTCGFCN